MFLVRLTLIVVVLAALAFGALFVLGQSVTPEQREVQVSLPMPKPKG